MGDRVIRFVAIGVVAVAGAIVLLVVVGLPVVVHVDEQMRAPGDASAKARVDRLVASLANGTLKAAVIRYLHSHGFRAGYANAQQIPMTAELLDVKRRYPAVFEESFAPQTQLRVFGGAGFLAVVMTYDVRIFYDGKERVRKIRVRTLGYGP